MEWAELFCVCIAAQKSIFGRGLEERSRKVTAVRLFRGGLRGEAGKSRRYDFQGGLEGRSPSISAAGATPHHKPSNFPAHSAPERAVVVLCPDKNDFRGYICPFSEFMNYLQKYPTEFM
jgi:hypothetical protein